MFPTILICRSTGPNASPEDQFSRILLLFLDCDGISRTRGTICSKSRTLENLLFSTENSMTVVYQLFCHHLSWGEEHELPLAIPWHLLSSLEPPWTGRLDAICEGQRANLSNAFYTKTCAVSINVQWHKDSHHVSFQKPVGDITEATRPCFPTVSGNPHSQHLQYCEENNVTMNNRNKSCSWKTVIIHCSFPLTTKEERNPGLWPSIEFVGQSFNFKRGNDVGFTQSVDFLLKVIVFVQGYSLLNPESCWFSFQPPNQKLQWLRRYSGALGPEDGDSVPSASPCVPLWFILRSALVLNFLCQICSLGR